MIVEALSVAMTDRACTMTDRASTMTDRAYDMTDRAYDPEFGARNVSTAQSVTGR